MEIESPGRLVALEADRHAEPAADHDTPFVAAVALELMLRARCTTDLVRHMEEVHAGDRMGRQPFPHDARGQADHLPSVGTPDRIPGTGAEDGASVPRHPGR